MSHNPFSWLPGDIFDSLPKLSSLYVVYDCVLCAAPVVSPVASPVAAAVAACADVSLMMLSAVACLLCSAVNTQGSCTPPRVSISQLGSVFCSCPDSDSDGTTDCEDLCPNDSNKTAPGICGCNVTDADDDGDGTVNCHDQCPNDASKNLTGVCGCGTPESASDDDGDGTINCNDLCPNDPGKIAPGVCGCNVTDADDDGDGIANCNDDAANDDDGNTKVVLAVVAAVLFVIAAVMVVIFVRST